MHQLSCSWSTLGLDDLLKNSHVLFCESSSIKLFSTFWNLRYSLSCRVHYLWCGWSWGYWKLSGSWWSFETVHLHKLMHQCTSCWSSLSLNDLLESSHVCFCKAGSIKLLSALWKLSHSLSCGVDYLWLGWSWCYLSWCLLNWRIGITIDSLPLVH